jgi:hypothetical protein
MTVGTVEELIRLWPKLDDHGLLAIPAPPMTPDMTDCEFR